MKITELRNVEMGVVHVVPENGEPEQWRITFTDKATGDVIWVGMTPEVKNGLVRNLMGGIVTPHMVVPRGKPR